jgi:hypothetical protein
MRTDEHRPSAIIPEDYGFVCFQYHGVADLGAVLEQEAQRAILKAHQERTGGFWAQHEHGGSCHVCGAHALYLVIWYHEKSNSYIQTGSDCADKMDMSYGDMNRFRRAIADAREAHAGKKKAIAVLGDNDLMQAWEVYESTDDHSEECVIRDIVGKLIRYGSISDNQTGYLRSLVTRINRRPIVEAQRAAEREAAAPVPTGRMRVQGVVVGTKTVEDAYSYNGGEKTMLIIKANEGFKVYGSRFNNLGRGDVVDMTATLSPSKDDPKFGFYKRPVQYVDPAVVKAAKAEAAFLKSVAWG